MKRELEVPKRFLRALRKYLKKHPDQQDHVHSTLEQISEDAFAPELDTHKLKGEQVGILSATAGYDLRILFRIKELDGEEVILLETIGTHDEVYGK